MYRPPAPRVPARARAVPGAWTLPLRARVLRPHESPARLRLPGDDDPSTGFFAVLAEPGPQAPLEAGPGAVLATGNVRREPPPWDPQDATAWRLRGMATDPAHRSRGLGAAVLAAAVAHVRARGGARIWCNARIPAVPFYLRHGFALRGEPWVDPAIGPHVALVRELGPFGGPRHRPGR